MTNIAPTTLLELADRVARHAIERQISLATAESCTGGLVAALLTATAGISVVFPGGVVAYANETKRDLLYVPQALLDSHGAVSEQVAMAMAAGARRRLGASLAVATTGIAGPGGATAGKPVGLVYVAVDGPGGAACRRFLFTGERAENTVEAARAALELLEEALSTARD